MAALLEAVSLLIRNLPVRWQEWRADDDEPAMDHWLRLVPRRDMKC